MSPDRYAIDIDAEDPGRGDPADIRAAAGRRRTTANASNQSASELRAAPAAAGSWQGATAAATTNEAHFHAGELERIAGQWEADAGTLEMYAATVQDIADRYRALRTSHRNAKYDLAIAENQVTEFLTLGERQPAAATGVAAAQARLQSLGAQYEQLLLERRATDNLAVMLLTGADARGGLAQLGAGTIGSSSVPTLAELAGMDRTDLATLLKLNPDLLAQLTAANPPENVAAWWGALDAPQQSALVFGASSIIGALGGIPPLARSAANRLNASRDLVAVEEEIAVLEQTITALNETGISTTVYQDQLAKMQTERTYVAEVAAGTVHLYLWDRGRGQIVEMVGDFTKEYSRVITYLPGTFTNLQSFYEGGTQDVAAWMTENATGTVAFVWKGADFPGQSYDLGDLRGINEANQQQLALDAGEALARFQHEIRTDQVVASAQSIAMGHSWGTAATTGSEVAGARYDQVHSLAGAWMPGDWKAAGDTDYYHWSYTDFLSVAQDLGLVGEGNVPDTDPDFESTIYERDNDRTVYLPTTTNPYSPSPAAELQAATPSGLVDNHSLMASQLPENLRALRDMRAAMQ